MCDGFWDGKVQSMNQGGVPKGMKLVLQENDGNTDEGSSWFASGFKDQKSKVRSF